MRYDARAGGEGRGDSWRGACLPVAVVGVRPVVYSCGLLAVCSLRHMHPAAARHSNAAAAARRPP
jgi:hypothetical protein